MLILLLLHLLLLFGFLLLLALVLVLFPTFVSHCVTPSLIALAMPFGLNKTGVKL